MLLPKLGQTRNAASAKQRLRRTRRPKEYEEELEGVPGVVVAVVVLVVGFEMAVARWEYRLMSKDNYSQ